MEAISDRLRCRCACPEDEKNVRFTQASEGELSFFLNAFWQLPVPYRWQGVRCGVQFSWRLRRHQEKLFGTVVPRHRREFSGWECMAGILWQRSVYLGCREEQSILAVLLVAPVPYRGKGAWCGAQFFKGILYFQRGFLAREFHATGEAFVVRRACPEDERSVHFAQVVVVSYRLFSALRQK